MAQGTYSHPTDPTWVDRFARPFVCLRPESRWYVFVDFLLLIMLAVITAIDPKTQRDCTTRSVAAMAIFVAQYAAMAFFQPFSAKFDNFFFVIGYALQLAAMGIVLDASIHGKDVNVATERSGRVLLCFAVMLCIKTAFDWWQAFTGCVRRFVQLDTWEERTFERAKSYTDEEMKHTMLVSAEYGEAALKVPASAATATIDTSDTPAAFGLALPPSVGRAEGNSTNDTIQAAAPLVCATLLPPGRGETKPRVVTGFQRAFDPAVVALEQKPAPLRSCAIKSGASATATHSGSPYPRSTRSFFQAEGTQKYGNWRQRGLGKQFPCLCLC